MSVAEVKDLCKTYPGFELRDISFNLNKGRITGFIGRNGAGKTTTIKSMLGLVHPSSGQISYFGMPFAENENEIKQRIGYSTGAINYYPKKRSGIFYPLQKLFIPHGTKKLVGNI